MKIHRHTSAFTLLELSAVLVIIGMVVGGIMLGTSLVRSSELKSITAEVDRIQVATNAFREKYNGLPGDITNATAFWGATHATFSNCINTASAAATPKSTCNGNGNGKILYDETDMAGVAFTSKEDLRAWKQLSNAGLYEGNYTGIDATGVTYDVGINIPQSRVVGTGFNQWFVGVKSADTYFYDGDYGHMIRYGRTGHATSPVINPVLATTEAWSIDEKYDDGTPGNGRIVTFRYDVGLSNLCATNGPATTSQYDLDREGEQCILMWATEY